MTSLSIIIPTYNAEKHLSLCLEPLKKWQKEILLVDSSSTDKTALLAQEWGVSFISLPKNRFNHGATREWARNLRKSTFVLFLTQDAYPSSTTIDRLLKPLLEGVASMSYGRQVPHRGADLLEAFPRLFHYPPRSHIRQKGDLARYGIKTFFCSNSCAAYVNAALDAVGGFPQTVFGEDTLVAARLIHAGHRVAYVAEARVRHSHSYTLGQEWRRHRLIGHLHQQHRPLLLSEGSVKKEGFRYLLAFLGYVWKKRPKLLPYLLLQTVVKYVAYYTGRCQSIGFFPNSSKRRLIFEKWRHPKKP